MIEMMQEHHSMLEEHKDVRKEGYHKYKNKYGNHFTKDLCEWAVSKMKNRNGTYNHYTCEDIKKLWKQYDLPDIHNANWYDVTFVANMAYADFYKDLFTKHYECLMYAYCYLSDIDGYEGIAFNRWFADIKAKDETIPWHMFNE